ncbi:MAG: ATP-binding protein [Rhodobacteraceae bacterium]|nr:ATP-binding protein [Paracoccaceae bacterium]
MIEDIKIKSYQKLSIQLYLAIAISVLITIVAVSVSWQSFERVSSTQDRVNSVNLPEMTLAFAISRTNAALVAAAPRLTAASSPEELEKVSNEITNYRNEFKENLQQLQAIGSSKTLALELETNFIALENNIESIQQLVAQYLEKNIELENFNESLSRLEQTIRIDLLPLIDDQFFYIMTGYRNLDDPQSPMDQFRSDFEINRYRHLSNLEKEINIAIQLLATVSVLTDSGLVNGLKDQFESTYDGILRSLEELGGDNEFQKVKLLFDTLFSLGLSEGNGFEIRQEELALLRKQERLLRVNILISTELVRRVEEIVRQTNSQAQEAIMQSNDTVGGARNVLLILGISSIVIAVLIAWLFVGRHILNRLQELSNRMQSMARGDLDNVVHVRGKDEIAYMARALEVFRMNSLEARRLNLVEELADELVDKNTELEKVLDELKTAQNQIVMREKLAALGELTAGVAHEIKNPLNFVKNFSESSLEILDELDDIYTDVEDKEELIEEVKDIAGILKENLERIHGHGTRADRIVHDMLNMGRGEAQAQKVSINSLVDEHAKLAYHSSRATMEGFRLFMRSELDPQVGEAIVIPQDLGRVILNIVTNACYATHKKRLELEKTSSAETPSNYDPELLMRTKKKGDRICISIRDNGNGIPDDVRDKIFNPFFTTKPTDEGTGLGLAMSIDIIRGHGGTIEVNSEPGSYTEFTVEIPDDASEFFSEVEEEEEENE